jgi:hypothetical protein
MRIALERDSQQFGRSPGLRCAVEEAVQHLLSSKLTGVRSWLMHTWEARIERGEYKGRQAILSNREAAVPYPVNMSAASRAVALLRDRGLVMGAPGGGVFGAEAPAGSRP